MPQAFVAPKGHYNNCMRIDWARGGEMELHQYTAQLRLKDYKRSCYDRAATHDSSGAEEAVIEQVRSRQA